MLPLAQKKSYIASIRGERQIHLQIASRGRKGRESRSGREGVFGQFVGVVTSKEGVVSVHYEST